MREPYLLDLSREAPRRHDIAVIHRAIDERGFWEEFDEWRICTVTEKRIELVQKDGKTKFHVRVACDTEHVCSAPTLERAVEFLGIFDRLIMDLAATVGWASWAARGRLDP